MDARIAPPFMEATDASRLVCVVVVSYQEYSLTHLGAPLLRCAYGHPSLPPCCFGCPAPRKHVSQLREETFSGPRAASTGVGKFGFWSNACWGQLRGSIPEARWSHLSTAGASANQISLVMLTNGQVEMGNLTMSRSSGDELHVVVNGFRSANRLATVPPKNSGRALPTRLG